MASRSGRRGVRHVHVITPEGKFAADLNVLPQEIQGARGCPGYRSLGEMGGIHGEEASEREQNVRKWLGVLGLCRL